MEMSESGRETAVLEPTARLVHLSPSSPACPPKPSPTHILTVLDLLQSLDFPEGLVRNTILQPPQGHLLEGNNLASLCRKECRHCQKTFEGRGRERTPQERDTHRDPPLNREDLNCPLGDALPQSDRWKRDRHRLTRPSVLETPEARKTAEGAQPAPLGLHVRRGLTSTCLALKTMPWAPSPMRPRMQYWSMSARGA